MTRNEAGVLAILEGVEILEHGRSPSLRAHWEHGAFRSIDGKRIALVLSDRWEVYYEPAPEPAPEPESEYEECVVSIDDVGSRAKRAVKIHGSLYGLAEATEALGYAGVIWHYPNGDEGIDSGPWPKWWSAAQKLWSPSPGGTYTREIYPWAVRIRKGGK